MMNKKKIAGKVLAVICIMLCAAGCVGKGGDKKEDNQTSAGELAGDNGNAEKKDNGIELMPQDQDAKEEQTEQQEADQALQPGIEELLLAYSDNGGWSVYVKGLRSGRQASVNDHRMQAASLVKLFICGTVYEHLEEVVAQESYAGETYKLLEAMLAVSDNDAANTLIKRLGNGDGAAGMSLVNTFSGENGYINTHLGRLMLDFEASDDNYTSCNDCGKFLEDVYNGNLKGSAEMLEILKKQTRTAKIPAGVPEGTVTANKTGELNTVENDAAVVWGINEPYIICVMSEGLGDAQAARERIKALSAEIYAMMQGE